MTQSTELGYDPIRSTPSCSQ